MIYSIAAAVPEEPFLLLLWIMACYTLVFTFVVELQLTRWIIGAIRAKLHTFKVQKQRQDHELELFLHLAPPQTASRVPPQRSTPSALPPLQRRSTRRYPGVDLNDWN